MLILSATVTSPSCGTGWGRKATPRANASTTSALATVTSSSRNAASVMSSSIGTVRTAYTGPVSSPSSTFMRQTPVSWSPARMARSTGAAPRQRGNNEKCRFTIGVCSSSRTGMMRP